MNVSQYVDSTMTMVTWRSLVILLVVTVIGMVSVRGQSKKPCVSPAGKNGFVGIYYWKKGDTPFTVKWTYRPDQDELDIEFSTIALADQWVAIGFSNTSHMDHTDIILAWITADGKSKITDRYSHAEVEPPVDEKQDFTNAAVTRVGTAVTLRFTRKRNTGDPLDHVITDDDCPYLLFAVGGAYDEKSDKIEIHSVRSHSRSGVCLCGRETRSPPCIHPGFYYWKKVNTPFTVKWAYRAAQDELDIEFITQASVDQWVAVGFSNSSHMDHTDIILATINNAGITKITDRYADSEVEPPVDRSQDFTNAAATRSGNTVTLRFTRKRNTGDPLDHVITDDDCPYLLFAVGGAYDENSDKIEIHSVRSHSRSGVCLCGRGSRNSVDVAIAMDYSDGDQARWRAATDTAREIVAGLTHFGQVDGAYVGAIKYATSFEKIFSLNDIIEQDIAMTTVSQTSAGSTGSRNTHLALDCLNSILSGGRTGVRKVVVVLTSGDPNDVGATLRAIRSLRASNTHIIIFDSSISPNSILRNLASRSDLYFNSNGFNKRVANLIALAIMNPHINACNKQDYNNGIYIFPDLQHCSVFHKCIDRNQVHSQSQSCPLGEFFDPHALSCRHCSGVTCSADPCVGGNVTSYPHHRICSAYWVCGKNKTVRLECCDSGFSYIQGTGCVPSLTCDAPCETKIKPVICNKRIIQGEPSKFEEEVWRDNWLMRDCAPGTYFSQKDCQCSVTASALPTKSTECNHQVYLSFDEDVQDLHHRLHVNNPAPPVTAGSAAGAVGAVGRGAARFDGNNRLYVQGFANAYFGDKFMVKFRFLERSRSSQSVDGTEVLFTNGGCGVRATVEARYLRANRLVRAVIGTTSGWMGKISLAITTVKLTSEDWINVEVRYDGQTFRLTVDGKVNETPARGNIASTHRASQIGCGCELDGNSFIGFIDELYIYTSCLP